MAEGNNSGGTGVLGVLVGALIVILVGGGILFATGIIGGGGGGGGNKTTMKIEVPKIDAPKPPSNAK